MWNIEVINDRLDIVWRASHKKWQIATRQNSINCLNRITLKLRDGIHFPWMYYIQQMMGHKRPLGRSHFGSANIQTTIDLPGVSRNNLSSPPLRQSNTQRTLS